MTASGGAHPQDDPRRDAARAVVTATEALLRGGATYAELSVERIAREAGISRTAFYFYFRDKRELLMRVTEEVMEPFYAAAERWWGGDDEAALEEALRTLAGAFRAHPGLLKSVVEVSTYDVPVARFWRTLVERVVDGARRRIAADQRRGAAGDGDPELLAFTLAWMTERALYQQLVQGRDDDEALVRALTTAWRRTIYAQ